MANPREPDRGAFDGASRLRLVDGGTGARADEFRNGRELLSDHREWKLRAAGARADQ
jgi:hypothetical protein